MTREDLDFIGSMNMCDEISDDAYKKIVCHCEVQEPCEDAISRADAKQFLYERIDRLNDDELYDIFSRIIDDMYNELEPYVPETNVGNMAESEG